MKYAFKVYSLKEHEKMPWCLLRDKVTSEGEIEMNEVGVTQQVQVARWVRKNFEHVSLMTQDIGNPAYGGSTYNPFYSCTWRDFKRTGEVSNFNGLELPKLFPSTFELEINLIK